MPRHSTGDWHRSKGRTVAAIAVAAVALSTLAMRNLPVSAPAEANKPPM